MDEQPASIWDLMLAVLVSPRAGMSQVAERRPVGTALAIIIGLSLFSLAMQLLGGSGTANPLPPELGSGVGSGFGPGLGSDFAEALGRLMPVLTLTLGLLGSIGLLFGWFIRAAIYRLLGEWMVGSGDGRAMLATLGFAALPGLLRPPLELMTNRVGSPALSLLVGLALWIWTAVLTVLAIQASFRTSTGHAVALFLIPIGALIGFAILAIIVMVIAMISLMPAL